MPLILHHLGFAGWTTMPYAALYGALVLTFKNSRGIFFWPVLIGGGLVIGMIFVLAMFHSMRRHHKLVFMIDDIVTNRKEIFDRDLKRVLTRRDTTLKKHHLRHALFTALSIRLIEFEWVTTPGRGGSHLRYKKILPQKNPPTVDRVMVEVLEQYC